MKQTDSNTLLKVGVAGTVIVALCCFFKPVMVLLLGAVGLAAAVGHLLYVLLPALAIFVALTAYAIWRRRLRANCVTDGSSCTR